MDRPDLGGFALSLFACLAAFSVMHKRRDLAAWAVAAHAATAIFVGTIEHGTGTAALVVSVAGVVMLLGAQRSLPNRSPVSENPSAL